MRAEIVAYMIYLERPEDPEYAMHIFYLKYSGTPNMGICQVIFSQPALPNKQQEITKNIRVVHKKGISEPKMCHKQFLNKKIRGAVRVRV